MLAAAQRSRTTPILLSALCTVQPAATDGPVGRGRTRRRVGLGKRARDCGLRRPGTPLASLSDRVVRIPAAAGRHGRRHGRRAHGQPVLEEEEKSITSPVLPCSEQELGGAGDAADDDDVGDGRDGVRLTHKGREALFVPFRQTGRGACPRRKLNEGLPQNDHFMNISLSNVHCALQSPIFRAKERLQGYRHFSCAALCLPD